MTPAAIPALGSDNDVPVKRSFFASSEMVDALRLFAISSPQRVPLVRALTPHNRDSFGFESEDGKPGDVDAPDN